MKKVSFSVIAGIALFTMSCNKDVCTECHYDDADGNEVELGEKCEDEIETLEAEGHTVDGTTYDVHCGEH